MLSVFIFSGPIKLLYGLSDESGECLWLVNAWGPFLWQCDLGGARIRAARHAQRSMMFRQRYQCKLKYSD